MKRILRVCLLLACLAFLCCGCSKSVDRQAVVGKTFTYEKNADAIDFTIKIAEDGSFEYYECAYSSYIGVGTWSIDGSVITLTDDIELSGAKRQNRFKIDGSRLVWLEDDSDNFIYVKLEDGAVFN